MLGLVIGLSQKRHLVIVVVVVRREREEGER